MTGFLDESREMPNPCRRAFGKVWAGDVRRAGPPTGTGSAGDWHYDTTAKRSYQSDGAGWVVMSEPIQTYVPTVTVLTVGNGTLVGSFHRSDGWCDFFTGFGMGSTSVMGTAPRISLPFSQSGDTHFTMFKCSFFDASAGARLGIAFVGDTVGVYPSYQVAFDSQAQIAATVPFVWANGDNFLINGRFRMASRYS